MSSNEVDRDQILALRRELVGLYTDVRTIKRVLFDAGVKVDRIDLSGSAVDIWQAALSEAVNDGRFWEIAKVASGEYPTNQKLMALAASGRGVDDRAPRSAAASADPTTEAMPPQRLYSDVFDSVNQRVLHAREEPDGPSTWDLYLGRFRLELLLRDEVVITDTQMFDGEFFVRLARHLASSEKELNFLRTKLVLRARRTDLESARLGFIRNNRGLVKSFVFSALSQPVQRQSVAEALADLEGRSVPWNSLDAALVSLGVPRDEVERLEGSWRLWDQFQTDGLKVDAWSANPPDFARAREHPRMLQGDFRSRPAALDLLRRVNDMFESRSKVESAIKESADAAAIEASDIEAIRAWYNRAYNRAIAWSHEANVFETTYATRYPFGSKHFDRERQRNIPAQALVSLAMISPDEYVELGGVVKSAAVWKKTWNFSDLDRALSDVSGDHKSRSFHHPDEVRDDTTRVLGALGVWDSVATFYRAKPDGLPAPQRRRMGFALKLSYSDPLFEDSRVHDPWSVTEYIVPAEPPDPASDAHSGAGGEGKP